jgi:hypothetical protein
VDTPSSERPWERVYTVHDYYDGPRAGFADFDGVPHAYLSTWSNALDDWEPHYRLWPVDAETFALALEDWAIWERWEDAFYAGETPDTTHPALPPDRARHDELEPVIDAIFESPPDDCRLADAEFVAAPASQSLSPGRLRPLLVRWTPAR